MTAAIRRAAPSDLEALTPLYAAFFEEDSVPTSEPQIRRNLAQMLSDDRAAIWIAEDAENRAIAMASATLSIGAEFGVSAEIEDLYVRPDHRGAGLARRLFETAVDWAEAQGARELGLVVTPEAEADQGLTSFYEKFGFADSKRILMYRPSRRRDAEPC